MSPPSIQVVHHELHHEILGPVFLEVSLENEAASPDPEDRHFTIQLFHKTQGFVKALGEVEVLCRQERPSSLTAG